MLVVLLLVFVISFVYSCRCCLSAVVCVLNNKFHSLVSLANSNEIIEHNLFVFKLAAVVFVFVDVVVVFDESADVFVVVVLTWFCCFYLICCFSHISYAYNRSRLSAKTVM